MASGLLPEAGRDCGARAEGARTGDMAGAAGTGARQPPRRAGRGAGARRGRARAPVGRGASLLLGTTWARGAHALAGGPLSADDVERAGWVRTEGRGGVSIHTACTRSTGAGHGAGEGAPLPSRI